MSNEKITVLYEIDDGTYDEVQGVLLDEKLAATWAADYRELNRPTAQGCTSLRAVDRLPKCKALTNRF